MQQTEAAQARVLDIIVLIVSLGIMLYLASYALLFWESPNRLVLVFVPLILIHWTLRRTRDGRLCPLGTKCNCLVGICLIGILAYSAYYFYSEYHALLGERAVNNNLTDMALGGLLLFLVLVATWKETGAAIPIVLLVFVAYAFLGKYFPVGSILHHAGIKFPAFMTFSVLSPDGIYGTLPIAGFTLVTIFVFFAGMVRGFGGLAYIINLSVRLTRRFAWGLPQIPVVSSMFFGTFSGAAAANVAGTGSFTIPMMKRFGVPPSVAGAIEAVASSGGQVMPPVMGVAAFLMADFLGVPYLRIVVIGFAPALLFYISTAFAVYLLTRDLPISKLPPGEREKVVAEDFRVVDGLPLAMGVSVLLFFLIYFRSSVLVSGMWMLITYLIAESFRRLFRARFSLSVLLEFLGSTGVGTRQGAVSVVEIILLLATMGVVAKMLVVTGLSQDLSYLMVDLSGGHLLLLLPLVFVVSILTGMAVSTVVVYIVVVLLAAPALVQYGIEPHVAHFTVFYLAILSGLTPPVAICVAVACRIANASFLRTGWAAIKIGISLFLLPFVFLFKPHILSADLATTPIAFLQILAGFLAITYGMNSRGHGIVGYSGRVLFFTLGCIAVFSSEDSVVWPTVGAIVILGAGFVMVRRRTSAEGLDFKPEK